MSDASDSLDVRLIQSFVRLIRRRSSIFIGVLIALTVVLVVARGIYTVPTNQTGALFRFGTLIDAQVNAGIHFRLPSPVDKVILMNTTEVRRYVISKNQERSIDMVTGDENLIEIDIAVQYQIHNYGSYLIDAEDWETLMSLAMEAALTEQVAQMTVDTVLTTGKNRIQVNLRRQLQETLAAYGDSIIVVSTRIVSITPPAEAARSFRSVSDARSESAKLISEARSQSNESLSMARGEAEKTLQQARSGHEERIKKAQGSAARFSAVLKEYRSARDTTRQEIYFSRVAKAIERADVIVMDPEQPVDLNLLKKK